MYLFMTHVFILTRDLSTNLITSILTGALDSAPNLQSLLDYLQVKLMNLILLIMIMMQNLEKQRGQ